MAEKISVSKDNINEFDQIMKLIKLRKNFLLSGGAGSGKTYSLVQIIKQVLTDNPTAKVACMTYTNAAVKEIENRVNHNHLQVTTIHDFLWDNIKHYKKELSSVVISLINDPDVSKMEIVGLTLPPDYFDDIEGGIQYREYLRLRDGVISHDELLLVALTMFSRYPKLCDILKDKYNFIFIDEYQDTHPFVVQIFLDCLKISDRHNIIGFFGDAMQSIYDDSIGNLNEYLHEAEPQLIEVLKKQNRRNPKQVYLLANKLRNDNLQQDHSGDLNAPNMLKSGEVKSGNIKFLYSANSDLDNVRRFLGWDFSSKETKELNLTHNLIAEKAGFRNLMDIYNSDRIIEYKNNILRYLKENPGMRLEEEDTFGEVIIKVNLNMSPVIRNFISENTELFEEAKRYKFSEFKNIYLKSDVLTDDKKQDSEDESKKGSKRDNLIKHLFKIQNNIHYYKENNFNSFLKATHFKISKISDKQLLKKSIEELTNVNHQTIEEIINKADECGICKIDDKLEKFKSEKAYAYNRIKSIKYSEFQHLYEYLEGHTPFSTQHKVKGDEFENVLVILDNGRWNNYNFQNLFLGNGTPRVLERTQKIFYVCCTRAKENLALFYHNPSQAVIDKAKIWFSDENVISI